MIFQDTHLSCIAPIILHTLCIIILYPGISTAGSISPEERREILNFPNEMPDSALVMIDKYLNRAKANGDSSDVAFLYIQKGAVMALTNQNMAVKYYFKAMEICKEINDSVGLAAIYSSLANIRNLSKQQKYASLKEGLKIHLLLKDTLHIVQSYNNFGIYYRYYQEYDSAYYYYQKCLSLSNSINYSTGIASAYNNMGKVLIDKKEYAPAIRELHHALKHMPKKRTIFLNTLYFNLMHAYFKLHQPDSAFRYFNHIQSNFDKIPFLEMDSYRILHEYYDETGDYKKALSYFRRADSVRETKLTGANENLFRMLELEYNSKIEQEKLATLNAKIAKDHISRIFLIIGLGVTIIFTLVVFYLQKQKSRKKRALLKAEQKLLNTELQASEIKRKYLNDELKYTNKELTSFATNIVQNQFLWKDTRMRISDMLNEKSISRIKDLLRELNTDLLQVFQSNEQRAEFLKRSQQLNHSLVFYLKSNFPELTEADVNLLILVFLKFPSKEIATLFNIEPASAKMKRNRVRKKLGLEHDESFDAFFERILENLQQARGQGLQEQQAISQNEIVSVLQTHESKKR